MVHKQSMMSVAVFLKYSTYHSFALFVVGIVYIKTRLHHQKFIQQQHSLLNDDQTGQYTSVTRSYCGISNSVHCTPGPTQKEWKTEWA